VTNFMIRIILQREFWGLFSEVLACSLPFPASGTGAPIRARKHTPRRFLSSVTYPLSSASHSSGLCGRYVMEMDACGPGCSMAYGYFLEDQDRRGQMVTTASSGCSPGASLRPCIPYRHFHKSHGLQGRCQGHSKIDCRSAAAFA
jgi:hypothetical protein